MNYKAFPFIAVLLSCCLLNCSPAKKVDEIERVKRYKDSFGKETLVGPQTNNAYVVSTSQIIEPAGKTITFPGRPVDLALNSNETILAVKNMTGIVFINVVNQSIIQTLELAKGGCTFKGIGWSANDKKVWVTDEKGFLRSARLNDKGLFVWDDEILLPGIDKDGAYPGGFAIDERKGLIYVTLNRNNTVGIVNMRIKG